MKYRHLGSSGVRVSEICLGTMSFGDQWGFGADVETSHQVMEAFADAGGNFLDTANKYHGGQTEQIVGEFIASDRDYWVLATKYTLSMRGNDPNAAGNSRKNMIRAVEASLGRLKTDYIDLLWVHAWDFCTGVEEVMRGLDDLVRQGKVGYVGISDAPAWVVSHANTLADLRGWTQFVGLQIQWSLCERTVERELVPMARAFDIGITPWGPLHAGVLTGKYTRGGGPGDSKRAAFNKQRLTERNIQIARTVDAVADELEVTSARVAVAWLRHQGADVFPIAGARKPEQICDVIGSTELTLSKVQLDRLDEVSKISLGFPHDFINSGASGVVFGEVGQRVVRPKPRG